jgi:hypothetical protein
MSGCFFDFAKQNQKNSHSFKIFFSGGSRQRSFDTASIFAFACKLVAYLIDHGINFSFSFQFSKNNGFSFCDTT